MFHIKVSSVLWKYLRLLFSSLLLVAHIPLSICWNGYPHICLAKNYAFVKEQFKHHLFSKLTFIPPLLPPSSAQNLVTNPLFSLCSAYLHHKKHYAILLWSVYAFVSIIEIQIQFEFVSNNSLVFILSITDAKLRA